MLYIWQTLNVNGENGYMRNIQTLEKSWILKNFKKRIHFPILKKTQPKPFFRPIGVFTSLGVAIFKVTLRDGAQIFGKREQFAKMIWFNLMSFSPHGSNVKNEKNVTWKNIPYFVWRLLQCFINYLEEWSDKSVCCTTSFHFTFLND